MALKWLHQEPHFKCEAEDPQQSNAEMASKANVSLSSIQHMVTMELDLVSMAVVRHSHGQLHTGIPEVPENADLF